MRVLICCYILLLVCPVAAAAQQHAELRSDTGLIRLATSVIERSEAADAAWPGSGVRRASLFTAEVVLRFSSPMARPSPGRFRLPIRDCLRHGRTGPIWYPERRSRPEAW